MKSVSLVAGVIGLLLATSPGGCDRSGSGGSATGPPPSAANIAAALDAADQYFNSRNYDSARLILDRLVEQAPDDVRARELYAQVLLASGLRGQAEGRPGFRALFEQSHAEYEAAIALKDDSAGLLQSAGEVAQLVGKLETALQHFTRAAELDPASAKHPLYAGLVLLAMDRRAEAESRLHAALAIDDSEPIAHASLASIALSEGDLETAGSHLGRARDLAPSDLGVRLLEARWHRASDNPGRAIELLISLPVEQRVSEAVVFQIAAAYGELDRHADAAAWWERRLRAAPDEERAWYAAVMAGRAHLADGRSDRAREMLQQAELRAPQEADVRLLATELAQHETGETQPSSADPSSNG